MLARQQRDTESHANNKTMADGILIHQYFDKKSFTLENYLSIGKALFYSKYTHMSKCHPMLKNAYKILTKYKKQTNTITTIQKLI